MKKLVLGSLFALLLSVACSEDSWKDEKSLTHHTPTVVRRSIPKDGDRSRHEKAARKSRGKASQFVYTRTACNIRRGPGTRYSIARRATKGEKLEYISREGNWYRLKVGKGNPQEWVHKSVVAVSKTPRS